MPLTVDIPENTTGFSMFSKEFWSRRARHKALLEESDKERALADKWAAIAEKRKDQDERDRAYAQHTYHLAEADRAHEHALSLGNQDFRQRLNLLGQGNLYDLNKIDLANSYEDKRLERTQGFVGGQNEADRKARADEAEAERKARAAEADKALRSHEAIANRGNETSLANTLIMSGAKSSDVESKNKAAEDIANKRLGLNPDGSPIVQVGRDSKPTRSLPPMPKPSTNAPPPPAVQETQPIDPDSVAAKLQMLMPVIDKIRSSYGDRFLNGPRIQP